MLLQTGPLLAVFLAMAIGNVVDIMQHVVAKYGSPTKLKRWALLILLYCNLFFIMSLMLLACHDSSWIVFISFFSFWSSVKTDSKGYPSCVYSVAW
jgi:hypothetical protein